MNLSNQPPKGTSDWYPADFKKKKYIFETWRNVCERFGYQEYLTPIIENAEIYRAKSGEDVGKKELWTLFDQGGREFAIRPEMTPSVTRMVSRYYESEPKPLRLFSIANFLRNEKPQRGRSREFWQLNYDIFGADTVEADIEILQVALEIMLGFNAPKDSFTLYINNRKLIDFILNEVASISEEQQVAVVRVLDKWEKLTLEDFNKRLTDIGLNREQINNLIKFMNSKDGDELVKNLPQLQENEGFHEVIIVMDTLIKLGYGDWIKFQPNIIRGFDYYDGIIFEVFDNNPENNRAMFGGGSYNGLASLFGGNSFPATGAAPGDATMDLFLESWNLYPTELNSKDKSQIYFPIIDQNMVYDVRELAKKLRDAQEDLIIETGVKPERINKALEYANKKGHRYVIIYGADEKANGYYKIKDMVEGTEDVNEIPD